MPTADRLELAAVAAGMVTLALAFAAVCRWATRIKRRIHDEE